MTVMSLTAWRALGGFAEQSKSFTSTYREGSGGINRYCRVLKRTLSMLEPYEVKVSCTVLRGLGAGNSPGYPTPREREVLDRRLLARQVTSNVLLFFK